MKEIIIDMISVFGILLISELLGDYDLAILILVAYIFIRQD